MNVLLVWTVQAWKNPRTLVARMAGVVEKGLLVMR
jgi:hypothetical protein